MIINDGNYHNCHYKSVPLKNNTKSYQNFLEHFLFLILSKQFWTFIRFVSFILIEIFCEQLQFKFTETASYFENILNTFNKSS